MTTRPTLPAFFAAQLAAAIVLALAAGCAAPALNDPVRSGPFFAPTNYTREANLGMIRRVVLMPIASGMVAASETAASLDAVFATALQQQNRFEIVTLSREECLRRFRMESLPSASALPAELLATLRREFAADAVMFVDLTVFQAYRPLELGLRAKLTTIDRPTIVWSFDQVFSAANPAVANAARHHFLQAEHSNVPADLTPAVLQSPARFAAYAASAMFSTLPPIVGNSVAPAPRRASAAH